MDCVDTMWTVAFYLEVVTSTLQKHMAVDPSPAGDGGFGVLISYHGIDSLAETSRVNRSEPEKVRGSSGTKSLHTKRQEKGHNQCLAEIRAWCLY